MNRIINAINVEVALGFINFEWFTKALLVRDCAKNFYSPLFDYSSLEFRGL